jgi:hypothetical protein
MKKILYILPILFVVFMVSCTKENSDTFVPYPTNPLNDTNWQATVSITASVYELRALLASTPQLDSFEVNANPTTLVFDDGTLVSFPSFSCTTPNGTAITGRVAVEFTQLKKRGDFIKNDKPTTANNYLLETGGSFKIRLLKNNQELILAPGKTYTVRYKDTAINTNMSVFYGNDNAVWQPAQDSSNINPWFNQIQGTTAVLGYQLNKLSKFNWVNCDYFIDSTLPKTKIISYLSPNFTNVNTTVFAVFKQQRIVVRLTGEYASKTFFANNIPTGKPIVLVSVSKIGSNWYLGIKDFTTTANASPYQILPQQKTQQEIITYLNTLE